jgi:tRNA isopentenyl-2-thiomethyl-A-37 hydroxylase MiaE
LLVAHRDTDPPMPQRWPSTEREFLRRFPDHESTIIHNLPPELQSASGSSWSAKHLQACRVLVQDHNGCIPILNDFLVIAADRISADQTLLDDLGALSREELRILSH